MRTRVAGSRRTTSGRAGSSTRLTRALIERNNGPAPMLACSIHAWSANPDLPLGGLQKRLAKLRSKNSDGMSQV